jgi:hypothetical protein
MASNTNNGLWSVLIVSLPPVTPHELSQTFNVSPSRVRIPTTHRNAKYYAFVYDFDSEQLAKDFACKWSHSSVFGTTIKCTAWAPKNDDSQDVLPKSSTSNVVTQPVLSEEPITSEEKNYYEGCKQYYHLTEMPLVSISDEVLNDNLELESVSFKFAIDEDYDGFNVENFLDKICNLLNINRNDINIRKIQKGSVLLWFDYVVKKINDTVTQIKMQVKSVYDALTNTAKQELGKLKVVFMFMGDISKCADVTKIRHEIKLYPQWNRIYAMGHTHWTGALHDGRDRGDSSYYCPVGWKRYSFYVHDNFDEKFKGWCICYHGTKFEFGLSILLSGLKPAQAIAHGKGIYASPSIIYASHPRYSEVKEIQASEQSKLFKHGKYVQFVLECRVDPKNRIKIGYETLGAGNTIIDPNINNNIIEWVIDHHGKDIVDFNDSDASIICTGLMIRVTDNHPRQLPESHWWHESVNEEPCNIIYE